MCWFQGENHKSLRGLNRECINRWKELNPTWQVNVLSDKTIADYVPEYFDIVKNSPKRSLAAKSDMLRLLVLEKYGGVWTDASLYPLQNMDVVYEDYMNKYNFFAYRYMPRLVWKSQPLEISSFFLISGESNLYLIRKWRESFQKRFTSNNRFKYLSVFVAISKLYDVDKDINYTINNMVQIDEKTVHSFVCKKDGNRSGKGRYESNYYCHLYKRPNLKLMRDYLDNNMI